MTFEFIFEAAGGGTQRSVRVACHSLDSARRRAKAMLAVRPGDARVLIREPEGLIGQFTRADLGRAA
ncbi:MAG TPA: hypothetical protein VG939_12475 [Caulobacteraceae bacterium]|nr:hypothetical protein [Caulobacteraceae bacterium]